MKVMRIIKDADIVTIDGKSHSVPCAAVSAGATAMHWYFDLKSGIPEYDSIPGNKPWEKGDENIETTDWSLFEPFFEAWKAEDESPYCYDPAVKGKLSKLFSKLGNLEGEIAQRKADGLPTDQRRAERDKLLAEMRVEGFDKEIEDFNENHDIMGREPYKGLTKPSAS